MIALPVSVVIIVAVMIAVAFLARYGWKQDRVARDVPPKPGATSTLAVAALVLAFLLPLVGVILGHVALYRIGTGQATGRRWADGALGVGYFLIIVELILLLIVAPSLRWF